MKKHERDAAIAKLQAEIEALRNTPDEPELHPMTLPLQRVTVNQRYYRITAEDEVHRLTENRDGIGQSMWNAANYYADEEQATRYAEAFFVLRLMRRQPGIVDPRKCTHWRIYYSDTTILLNAFQAGDRILTQYMFPAFESEAAAQAAIDAVGAGRIIAAAEWLAGVLE